MRIIILVILLITSYSGWLASQTNDDCITCHDDHELTMEKGR